MPKVIAFPVKLVWGKQRWRVFEDKDETAVHCSLWFDFNTLSYDLTCTLFKSNFLFGQKEDCSYFWLALYALSLFMSLLLHKKQPFSWSGILECWVISLLIRFNIALDFQWSVETKETMQALGNVYHFSLGLPRNFYSYFIHDLFVF